MKKPVARKPAARRKSLPSTPDNPAPSASSRTPVPAPLPEAEFLRFAAMWVAVDVPQPDPDNANTHTRWQLEQIAASLREHGMVRPIVLAEGDVIAAGEGTWRAVREVLGWAQIWVSRTGMPLADARRFALRDNRLTRVSEFDYAIVQRQIKAIEASGQPIDNLGWQDYELKPLLKGVFGKGREPLYDGDETDNKIPPSSGKSAADAPPTSSETADNLMVFFMGEEMRTVLRAVRQLAARTGNEQMTNSAALARICEEWLE